MHYPKSVTAARKRRAQRLLRKAEITNDTKLMVKAKQLMDDANKAFFAKCA
ncbi:hypothetical protein J4N45_09985 [Vibrio sp. SCSIO 43140]|uniref:hypothetical protein n=1 Tax=Vibrio sp. SCSIO 43140 TaxID=2819100 RepID=UPI0020761B64|nr:hypothetical protein [Vibrio sp. SCSIO 43140]USD58858.1 hypothetical protein J4N45_09985 [Vibrio sp. SCSIO 43140]